MMGQIIENPNGGKSYATEQEVREICPECSAEIGLSPDYTAPISPSDRRAELLAGLQKQK